MDLFCITSDEWNSSVIFKVIVDRQHQEVLQILVDMFSISCSMTVFIDMFSILCSMTVFIAHSDIVVFMCQDSKAFFDFMFINAVL